MENSEFVLFQTFQKLWKNYVKIEFWKSGKLILTQMFGLKFGMQGLSLYIAEVHLNNIGLCPNRLQLKLLPLKTEVKWHTERGTQKTKIK